MTRARTGALAAAPVAEVEGLSRADLPNGLRVYFLHREGSPLLSARLVFPRGSARAPAGKSGLAELTAQLLRRGTHAHSADEINEILEGAGTDLGTWVSDDSTRLTVSMEARTAERLLQLVAELLREPLFPKGEVASLRDRTCSQLKSSLDDAEWVASRAAYRAVFAGHVYGLPAEGWVREVAALRRKDFRDFAHGYVGRGAALVLAGDLKKAPLEAWLEPLRLLPLGPSTLTPLEATKPLQGRGVLIVDKRDASQTQIRLVGTGFRRDAEDYVPAVLGNAVLGEGFSSRLVNEVRVNRGLTYGISSRFGALVAGGMFIVRSFTRLDKVAELVDVVVGEMQRLRDDGPTDEELARVRTYLGGAFRLGTETADQVGSQVLDAFRGGMGDDWVVRYPRLLEETSRAEVAEALRRRLPVDAWRVVAVGPAKELERKLKRFGPVEVVPLKKMI